MSTNYPRPAAAWGIGLEQPGPAPAAIDAPATATVPLLVRHATPGDARLVAQLLATVDPKTYYSRFFTARSAGGQETRQLAELICGRSGPHIALIATIGGAGRETAIALAECVPVEPAGQVGEIALLVHDSYQDLGVGSVLFDLLVQDAGRWPFASLHGLILGDNRRLLQGLSRMRLGYTATTHSGAVRIEIDLGQNRSAERAR
ncbi:MAG TPA: hypothetical protein VD886_11240 [Herpetosiphonaceae bacterium]|nr:hypothetical protein [Herpetosiphonaceae bacterium]